MMLPRRIIDDRPVDGRDCLSLPLQFHLRDAQHVSKSANCPKKRPPHGGLSGYLRAAPKSGGSLPLATDTEITESSQSASK